MEALEVVADCLYTLISIVTAVYGARIWRHMRRRVGALKSYGNGRLVLARGVAAASSRKLAMAIISTLIGALVTYSDVQSLLEPGSEASPFSLLLRALFITMIFLVMDALRIQERTYMRSERYR